MRLSVENKRWSEIPFIRQKKTMSFIYYDHKFFKVFKFSQCALEHWKKVSQEVYFALKCYKSKSNGIWSDVLFHEKIVAILSDDN